MSEDIIRVKDIAQEFDIKNKDVTNILQHLKIKMSASYNTTLSHDETVKVKEYIRQNGVELVDVNSKKNSKVFVRRRDVDKEEPIDASENTVQEESIAPVPAIENVVEPIREAVREKAVAVERKASIVRKAPSATIVSPAEKASTLAVEEKSEVPAQKITTPATSAPTEVVKDQKEQAPITPQRNEKPQVRIISKAEPRQWEPPTTTISSAPKSQNSREPGRQDLRTPRTHPPRDAKQNQGRDLRTGQPRDPKATQARDTRPNFSPASRNTKPSPGGAPVFDTPFPLGGTQSKKKQNKNKKSGFEKTGDRVAKSAKNYNPMLDGDATPRRMKSRKDKQKKMANATTQPVRLEKRKLRVDEYIRVSDMAHQLGVKASELVKALFDLGVMATVNQPIDIDTATIIASEYGYEIESVGFSEEEALLPTIEDTPENLLPRSPVVTIMGHVDHGKTSLLDAIRRTNVIDKEAGGITQHIGAYHVTTAKGDIVFLDTPGHEAFTAMRLRGAEITDLVVLVVAADDGVMEQTREAVNHARVANVNIMVAVNKMDKDGANIERVQRELAELGLVPEDWGGDTVYSYVSAKTGAGIEELLEMIALQSEILDLKANPNKLARGRIIEAHLDKRKGPIATVLIQEGTLHHGDYFLSGVSSGRVRAMVNDQGKKIKEAGPSLPVEIHGFSIVPEAGEEFIVLEEEKVARRIAEVRAVKLRERQMTKKTKVTLETFLSTTKHVGVQTLNLIVKADVQGSLEAIVQAVEKLSGEKVRINVLHSGTGAISESDILLASTAQAIIIGFNIKPTARIKEIAEQEHVDIRFYDIIYKLSEDIQSAMQGMLSPITKEVYLGQAEVREVFSIPKQGVVAGSFIVDGKVQRNAGVRLLRDGVVVYTGTITSLKRFKDDAKEVTKGHECGFMLANFNDIKVGDIAEAFEMKEEKDSL